jgi:hypothetical protein
MRLFRKDTEHYLVSLRAPNSNRIGADEIAGQFPIGGGCIAAADINSLPVDQLELIKNQYP